MSYSIAIVKYSCTAKVLLAVKPLLAFLSVKDKNGGTLAVSATWKHTAETRGQSVVNARINSVVDHPLVVKATYLPHFLLST